MYIQQSARAGKVELVIVCHQMNCYDGCCQDDSWHDCCLHREGGPHVHQAEQDGGDRDRQPRVGREYHQEGAMIDIILSPVTLREALL